MQSVPLVVVEEAASAAERKIGEAAVDAPAAKRELIGISEINLAAVVKARRAQNEFPAANARALDGDGDENLRVVEIVVVKEIIGASEEVIGVEGPATKRDSDAELVFFIAFAMKRHEAQVLARGELNQRAGKGEQRGCLVEMAVKAAEDPL